MRLIASFLLPLALLAQTATFPTAVVTNSQMMVGGNNLATVLTVPVTASDTTLSVITTNGLVPNMLLTFFDTKEIVVICAIPDGVHLTLGYNGSCPGTNGRGFNGTTAVAHAAQIAVSANYTAWHRDVDRVEIEAIETALGASLSHIVAAGPNSSITSITGLTTPLAVNQGGTGTTTPVLTSGAKISISGTWPNNTIAATGVAASGANSDITSLTGLTTPLSVAQGGSGTNAPSIVHGSNISVTGSWPNQTVGATGLAASGANADITSLTGLTTPLSKAQGGTGTTTPGLTAGAKISIIGTWPNNTIAATGVAASGANSDITSLTGITTPLSAAQGGTGTATPGLIAGSHITITGSWPNNTLAATGLAAAGANSDITSLTGLTTPLSVVQGGSGTATPGLVAGMDVSVTGSWPNQTIGISGGGFATAGANSDITSITGLTTPLSVVQGGSGTATPGLVAGMDVSVTGSWPNQTIGISGGGFATAGANSDITSLTGLTTPLSKAQGGTGTATPALVAGTDIAITGTWPNQTIGVTGAGFALSGANSDITSLTGLTTPLSKAQGGTGTAAPALVAGMDVSITGTWPNQTIAISGGGFATAGANSDITSLTGLTTPLSVVQGGSGTATPGLVAGTHISLAGSWPNNTIATTGVAGSGANSDITSLSALSTPLSKAQGGTGTTTPNLIAGSNVTISGAWPNQTINSSGGGGGGGYAGLFNGPTTLVCDGSTDVNTAFNALLNVSGGTIVLGPGLTCIITNLGVTKNGITLDCEGSTLKAKAGTTGVLLNVNGITGFTIRNCIIDGSLINPVTYAISVVNSTNLVIEHNTFQNIGTPGVSNFAIAIDFFQSGGIVDGNIASNIAGYCFLSQSSTFDLRVVNNHCDHAYKDGYVVGASTGNTTLSGNTCKYIFDYGAANTGAYGNCVYINTASVGINVLGTLSSFTEYSGIRAAAAGNVNITGSVIDHAGDWCILASDFTAPNNNVTGNVCRDSQGGIDIANAADDISFGVNVSGNQIYNMTGNGTNADILTPTFGVGIWGDGMVNITGNTVNGAWLGIQCNSGQGGVFVDIGCTVSDNLIIDTRPVTVNFASSSGSCANSGSGQTDKIYLTSGGSLAAASKSAVIVTCQAATNPTYIITQGTYKGFFVASDAITDNGPTGHFTGTISSVVGPANYYLTLASLTNFNLFDQVTLGSGATAAWGIITCSANIAATLGCAANHIAVAGIPNGSGLMVPFPASGIITSSSGGSTGISARTTVLENMQAGVVANSGDTTSGVCSITITKNVIWSSQIADIDGISSGTLTALGSGTCVTPPTTNGTTGQVLTSNGGGGYGTPLSPSGTCTGIQTIVSLTSALSGICGNPTPATHAISAAYTAVLADANTYLFHPASDTTARTWAIPSNASVAYPVNTCLSFFNDVSAGILTISINTDTLLQAGTAATGSRSLAATGIATACKVATTEWIINGVGLT